MRYQFLGLAAFFTFFTAFAEETPSKDSPDVGKISEAFGHLIGKNLHSMGVKFDIAKVMKGLQEEEEGKTAPMTEMEFIQAVTSIQEAAFKDLAVENLKKSEEFLANNQSASGIKVLEKDKLQYRVEKEGTGPAVDEHCTPLIRFSGNFLDGTPFSSKEEERISLEEKNLLPGFEKILLGMKEGEKRTAYIHPELAYGMKNVDLPPNSLITLDIEVLKANAPAEEPLDALTTSPSTKDNPEIAHPFEEPRAIR